MNKAKSQVLLILKLAALLSLVLAFCVPASAQCSWLSYGTPPTASGNPPTGTFVLNGMQVDYLNLFPEYHGVGCKFTRTTDSSWITLSDFRYPAGYDFSCIPNVTCPGTPGAVLQIAYSFEPNPTSQPRVGHIFISGADQILTVNIFEAAVDHGSHNLLPLYQAVNPDGSVPKWANDPYDGTLSSIAHKGCALTALTMALNYSDPTLGLNSMTLDPGMLNKFVETLHDYTDDGGLIMNAVVRDVSNGELKLNDPYPNSHSNYDLDQLLTTSGYPVIVGVNLIPRSDGLPQPSHYVIVTGGANGSYSIVDPGHPLNHSLGAYGNVFVIRGYVADPPGDISALELSVGNNAEMLITDPAGRRVGNIPGVQSFGDIPGGAYLLDSLDDSVTGAPPTAVDHSISLSQPQQGQYTLVLTGIGAGPYTLSARGYSQAGVRSGAVTLPGSIAVGSSTTFVIQFASGASPSLTITPQSGVPLHAPFGNIDTPTNTVAPVAGAIGVTGWALSNPAISDVEIWREPVSGEAVPANGLVFVEKAVIVPGSRPDVGQAYAGYPNNMAGWGAQLLTNMLPGVGGNALGNGTYRIHAIATNGAGQTADLGVRALTVDNARALLPFGTIDTPAQGATASGSAYVNFGWALTPNPGNVIPKDGSTIWVFIDNKPVGHPVYDNNRADISGLFPGLQNSNGAVGYYHIDTTKLSNGLHTISWSVTDTAGNAQGLGSRFFNVQN